MPGPPPDDHRVRRAPPERPWRDAPGHGWQHGKVPPPPEGLTDAAEKAWQTWLGAWWAGFWSPDDVPGLRMVARLYDQVERGEYVRSAELRQLMNAYGLTPAGRQALRWRPALEPEAKPQRTGERGRISSHDRLRIMGLTDPPNGDGPPPPTDAA